MNQDLESILFEFAAKASAIGSIYLDDEIPDALDNLIGEYADKVREAVGE